MTDLSDGRIRGQFVFLADSDKLKSIVRQSPLINVLRRENAAKHSWHLAIFAIVLSEYAEGVDILHAVKLLLLHDVVEIDAGDTPLHMMGKDHDLIMRREKQAAERIFGLLPADQGSELLSLWLEFEAAETQAARFAKALDRLQPLFLNTLTGGGTWSDNRLTELQVNERYGPIIEAGSPALWREAAKLVRRHFALDRQ
jgi:putative hydrolase of HD superfamily